MFNVMTVKVKKRYYVGAVDGTMPHPTGPRKGLHKGAIMQWAELPISFFSITDNDAKLKWTFKDYYITEGFLLRLRDSYPTHIFSVSAEIDI